MNGFKSPEIVCCVHGCDSKLSFRTFENIKLHAFPRKKTFHEGEDLLLKWINAIKLARKYTKRMRVCSLHFKEEDFNIKDGKKELKPLVVPSRNLPKVYRNKFYPRDYGRMIKLLEYRGIGKLRLCHEAKLSRRRYHPEKSLEKFREKPVEIEKSTNESGGKSFEEICVPKVSTTFSLAEEEPRPENFLDRQHFTSEIMIKEEPLSEPEDMEGDEMLQDDDKEVYAGDPAMRIEDQQDTVEEMLAKMNADDVSLEGPDNQKLEEKMINRLNFDYEDTIDSTGTIDRCDICGEEDCIGHEKYPEFECVPCGKVFKTHRQLNAHNLSHFEYRNKRLNAEAEARAQGRQTTCKVCHKVLSTKITLTEHMLIHSGEKPHICMLCDKAFRHKANLVQHVNTHTLVRNYKCKMCRQYFYTLEELDRHIRKHRIVKNDYSCRECGQSFRTKAACWAHLNSHTRGKTRSGLACHVCGRVLSTKATLKEHMFIHSGEKPFECLLCGKKIRHRANFIIHVQGHSLGRPHICSSCGLSFARKSELNSHIAMDHPDDRPFPCIICGMRFRTESRFLKHAVSHDATLEEY